MNYKEWILKQAGQIVLLVSQINFNRQVINCFESNSALERLGSYRKNLVLSINEAASVISKELTNYKTLTVEALLTIEVHSRDTLSSLIENKVGQFRNILKHIRLKCVCYIITLLNWIERKISYFSTLIDYRTERTINI